MSNIILDLKNINKYYGNLLALDNVSFKITKNSIHGILGPNGSGKSTLMRILSGLIKSWEGKIRINGEEISDRSNQHLKSFGFMIENPSFYEYLSAEENLKILSRLIKCKKNIIEDLLEKVSLTDWRNTKVQEFSYGMKQRLGIAQALLHNPEILILDEPNNGLDPGGIRDMNNLISNLQQEGKTICISTHILKDVELLCSDVTVLKKGKLILSSSMKNLMEQSEIINITSPEIELIKKALEKIPNSKINIISNNSIMVESKMTVLELFTHIPMHVSIHSATKDSGLTKLFL
tara:strand:- start:1645 stop:2520 length:876 start_codon:yes stop_codon:yes gene_type:complete